MLCTIDIGIVECGRRFLSPGLDKFLGLELISAKTILLFFNLS